MGIKPLKVIEEMKATMVEAGKVPPKVRDFFENVQKHGNPYGEPAEKRADWMHGSKVKRFDAKDEYLLYIGCVGSYDTRSQEAARALAHVLSVAGVSYGVLGEKERCDGNEVLRLGERDLFQYMAEENIKLFKELGVSKIITLSPHSYNVFRNEYPALGGNYKVVHYTQLVAELLKSGRLALTKSGKEKIAFHDPCLLGRYNDEYAAPRAILAATHGAECVELGSSKEHSFCCGGGGGNFYTDLLGNVINSPARIRVREALAAGARTLAVACPKCLTMLDNAVKAEDAEGKIKVQDIAEILAANC
jgi:Fe-S oxidoreductase